MTRVHLVHQSATRVHKNANLVARNLGTVSPAVKYRDVNKNALQNVANHVHVHVHKKRILTILAIQASSLAETELVKSPSLRKCATEECKSTKHAMIVL